MTEKRKPGRPKGSTTVDPGTATERKVTVSIRKDLLNKVQLLALAESYRQSVEKKIPVTIKFKEVVNEAVGEYVTKYEKKHGEL